MENVLGNESQDGKPTVQFVRNSSNVGGSQCGADNKDGPAAGHKERVKRQLAAVPISPEARRGNGFTLERRDLDWHMKGFLAEGNAFSGTAQSHLLLLLLKNIEFGVFF